MWIRKICTTVSKLKVLASVGDHPKPVTPVLPQLTAPFPSCGRFSPARWMAAAKKTISGFRETDKTRLTWPVSWKGANRGCWKQKRGSGAVRDHPGSPAQVAFSCNPHPSAAPLSFSPRSGLEGDAKWRRSFACA